MLKGFISFKSGRIPFVIESHRLELFTDDQLLTEFIKEYNFKTNYILTGQCFDLDAPRGITMLVERSLGSTCYLICFWVNIICSNNEFNAINFHSDLLDSIFRYKYNYLDISRSGENLSAEQKEVYSIPFRIGNSDYQLKYKIGQKQRMGLLEDFEMWGETTISLNFSNIEECHKITTLIERFAKFMASSSDVSFRRITLSNDGRRAAYFYCKCVSDKPSYEVEARY
ncbi:MAG: hypothetical protein EOM54_00090 [Clostridia bacterium]|nr:hypothetical protein [Clostridia bacterium]